MAREIETYSQPENWNANNVVYWEETSKELRAEGMHGALLAKAKKFLENDCIKEIPFGWACLPIEGYNKTSYEIKPGKQGFTCNCQGFKTRIDKGEKRICSHILAVKQLMYINRKRKIRKFKGSRN